MFLTNKIEPIGACGTGLDFAGVGLDVASACGIGLDVGSVGFDVSYAVYLFIFLLFYYYQIIMQQYLCM